MKAHCHIYGPGKNKHRTSGKTASDAAISLEPGGWGSAPDRLDNITIKHLKIASVLMPLSVTLGNDNELGRPHVRNIVAKDITRIALSVKSRGKGHVQRVDIKNVNLQFCTLPDAKSADYFADLPTDRWPFFPSWAMYFRNVGQVNISHARLSYEGTEARKPIAWDNVGSIQEKNITVTP